MILRALERLRTAHANAALPDDLVSRIQRDKARAEVDLPGASADYQNVCWDCYRRGTEVIVDKRVDPVCETCSWVQCAECGACRDPKFGGCPNRVFRGNRRAGSQVRRSRYVALEPSWKHADVFPIIARIIETAYQEKHRFVKAQDIAARLLQETEGRNLFETARDQTEETQSLEWLASNMVSWFSQRITIGDSDWARAFERKKIDGLWAYKPVTPS
jgi:hypothetical protein